jgi:hypothetical protein
LQCMCPYPSPQTALRSLARLKLISLSLVHLVSRCAEMGCRVNLGNAQFVLPACQGMIIWNSSRTQLWISRRKANSSTSFFTISVLKMTGCASLKH